jgi:LmbE family N-acetylglucosaminyl deacetylase
MRVLAVGAHPDDVELGLGGTIARHAEDGDEVCVLVLSRGERGFARDRILVSGLSEEEAMRTLGNTREEETRAALSFLGVKRDKIEVLGFPDSGIRPSIEAIETVSRFFRELNPDIVYTHFHGDSHLDHVSASLITVHAGRHAKNLLFYESPSTWTSFSPNYFVDIGGFLDKKIEALKMHRSQAEKPYMREEVIRAKAALRGSQAGVEYAEAFIACRIVKRRGIKLL